MSTSPQNPSASASDWKPKLGAEEESGRPRATARRVAAAVERMFPERFETSLPDLARLPVYGAFVSLKCEGRLRSCCGYLHPAARLGEAVSHAADRAATDDPRFPPIEPEELDSLDMEVWLLWGPEEVAARGKTRGGPGGRRQTRPANLPRQPTRPAPAGSGGRARFRRPHFFTANMPQGRPAADAWLDDGTASCVEGYAIRGRLTAAMQEEERLPFEPRKLKPSPTCGSIKDSPLRSNLIKPISKRMADQPSRKIRKKSASAPAGRGGQFYPARPDHVKQMLDLFSAEPAAGEPWAAAMVPHAGWIYSGRLAAAVWRRLQIPKRVIILCPKHRGGETHWAAAPYRRWLIPAGRSRAIPSWQGASRKASTTWNWTPSHTR